MEKRQEKVVELIRNQTNYTNDEIIEKLKLWNNDYLSIIKEYLNPTFNEKKKEKNISTNQKMMKEIRKFMDTSSRTFINQKKETHEDKLKTQLYTHLVNVKQSEIDKLEN
jgi:hypothetical protein